MGLDDLELSAPLCLTAAAMLGLWVGAMGKGGQGQGW